MAIERSDSAERFVAPQRLPEDSDGEFSLRPRKFADLIGRDKIVSNLNVYIQAAKNRGLQLQDA